MLVLFKYHMKMTMDFEQVVICALLLRFRQEKARKEDVGSSVTQPKTT